MSRDGIPGITTCPTLPCFSLSTRAPASSRAIVFDARGAIRAAAQREFTQHYPAGGWVEHDPEELWSATLAVTREALAVAGGAAAAIGITNQRETTVVWDRASGAPIHRAIVWQDRRTAERCRELREAGHEPMVSGKTGLLLDPYFSAPSLHGSSTTSTVRASARRPASSRSAPSTPF